MKVLSRFPVVPALALASMVQAAPPQLTEVRPTAPPRPPAIQTRTLESSETPSLKAAATIYYIGDPTPEEQLYVEMINRARADAVAESLLFLNTTDTSVRNAYSQFDVDLTLMLDEFAALPPVQPVAIHPLLTEAARRHTGDMLENVFQDHLGSDGSKPSDRVDDTGYDWSTVGENIFARARDVFHGHAAFEVDWGLGPGGMQEGRGHRATIHNAAFREVGVGVLLGTNERPPEIPVGPQLVTQVFATAQGSTPFITGVAYFDLNGNNFYDLGEGIGGVTVEASGTATQAVTARSGGYALPVVGNGIYTVTFSGEGFTPTSQEITVVSDQNVKVDFTPTYTEPVISGPTAPAIERPNQYSFDAVPGAEEHEWRSFQKTAPQPEGAENGTAQIIIDQSEGYEVISSAVKASGTYAFHLVHPAPPVAQTIALEPSYLIGPTATMEFESRLGYAAEDQKALVQVSADNGVFWQTVWNQSGSNGPGETAFSRKSVNLSAYEGQTLRVRFVYDWQSGGYFSQIDPDVGWWIDDISLDGMNEVTNEHVAPTTATTFSFQPADLGEYGLQVRGRTGHHFLPWGPIYSVEAVEGGNEPAFVIAAVEQVGNELHLELQVTAGEVQANDLAVQSATDPEGPWSPAGVSVQTNLQIIIPMDQAPARFFRVVIE